MEGLPKLYQTSRAYSFAGIQSVSSNFFQEDGGVLGRLNTVRTRERRSTEIVKLLGMEKRTGPQSQCPCGNILDCSNNLPGMEPPRANSRHQLGLAHHLGHPVCHKSRAQPGHYCLEWSYVYGYTIDECLSLLACSFLPLPTYLQLFGTLAALTARDRPHHHHSRALGQWLQHFEVVVVDRALVAPLHRPLGSINIPPDGG